MTFHTSMLRIKEIQSILPPQVNVMALTATASKSLREPVTKLIGLKNPLIIAMSPCKKNLKYAVCKLEFETFFEAMFSNSQEEKSNFLRTIVY